MFWAVSYSEHIRGTAGERVHVKRISDIDWNPESQNKATCWVIAMVHLLGTFSWEKMHFLGHCPNYPHVDVNYGERLPRGTKTIVALWHCHPESFWASGKFLRVTHEIALGSFQTVWKISGWSGKFSDSLNIFQMVHKISGYPGKFPDSPDIFQMVKKVSGKTGKFPDIFRMVQKVSG